MEIIYWLAAVNLLPLVGLVLLAVRPRWAVIPWMGLLTVVIGTFPAFSSSATLVERGSVGVGIGWLIASFYGLIGLGVVVGSARLSPPPLVSVGSIVAGVIHIASFYAFLPPYMSSGAGILMFASPGAILIGYGAYLWWRGGDPRTQPEYGWIARLGIPAAMLVGFVVMAVFIYQWWF